MHVYATAAGVFRLLEAIGRGHEKEQQLKEELNEASPSEPKRGNVNASRAAAIAAAVALLLLDGKRKNVVIAYAAIEALLALSREHTSIADIKYIGALCLDRLSRCSVLRINANL